MPDNSRKMKMNQYLNSFSANNTIVRTMKKYEIYQYDYSTETMVPTIIEADRVEILEAKGTLAFYKDWDMVAAFSNWTGFKVLND